MQESLIKKYPKRSSLPAKPFKQAADPPPVPLEVTGSDWKGAVLYRFKALTANEALLNRVSTHLTVLLLAMFLLGLSHLPLSWGKGGIRPLEFAAAGAAAPTTIPVEKIPPLVMPDQLNNTHNDLFFQAAAPHTVVPPRSPEKIATYTVQEGDTVTTIAYQFDLSPETIMWSNPNIEENPHWLQVGQEITILPTNGVYHQVGSSDTIEKIASTYKVDPLTIIDYPLNHIDPLEPTVTAGEWVVVPGGSKPFVPTVVRGVNTYQGEIPTHALAGSGIFAWPLSGRISQGYWSVHRAIDIESPVGSPVAAADSGFVTAAGWDDTGYGYFVIIDHGNGLQTMYAHLNAYYVEAGDNVYAGQTIGEVGTTGRASGPHLHFEVREGSLQLNPSQFLP